MAMEGAGSVFYCSEFSAGRQPVPRETKSTECNGEIGPCFMMEAGPSNGRKAFHGKEDAFMEEKRPGILLKTIEEKKDLWKRTL
jgi:hypothetical protein|nr:hypothetical protein [uncultured Acetatifactor sp.]